nr:type II toxin-antitoxin system HicA family toxin [Tautonia plasticadhaerens]
MIRWHSTKARHVLAALLRIGWSVKCPLGGSHRVLEWVGWPDFVSFFHDTDEIGPRMLARVARQPGLTPDDLWTACRSGRFRLFGSQQPCLGGAVAIQ